MLMVNLDCERFGFVQVDVFAFGLLLYELFTYTMTSAIVMGPRSARDRRAAELYALKVIYAGLFMGPC